MSIPRRKAGMLILESVTKFCAQGASRTSHVQAGPGSVPRGAALVTRLDLPRLCLACVLGLSLVLCLGTSGPLTVTLVVRVVYISLREVLSPRRALTQ